MFINLVSPASINAQNPTATLSGIVMDQNGALIPGVKVAVISIARGFQRQVTADQEGSFVVSFLPPGKYTVKAEHEGFAPVEIRDVILNVNDRVKLTIHLNVGSIGQTVDVRENASLINESMAVGTLVDRQFVENLPLNGRSFQSLIGLTPGAVLTKTTSSEQGQFSINGQRANSNYFTVDGVSANIGVTPGVTTGQSTGGTLPGLSAYGGTNNLVSVEALQEFKILTSTFAPEFGRTPGAQISIATRSGTNNFHGTLFEYFRNDLLDANDWFANSRGLRKPALRQNDFGGVFGGPILVPRFGDGPHPMYDGHNKTFFFFSYEGLRLRLPQTAVTTVPSLSAREAAPSEMQPFLRGFPVPNGEDLANNFSEHSASFTNPSSLNATSIRVDHVASNRLTLFARYNHAPSEVVDRGGVFSLNTLTSTVFRTQTLTVNATLAISASSANDFRANYSRNRGVVSSSIDDFGGAAAFNVPFPNSRSIQDSLFNLTIIGGTGARLALGQRGLNVQRQINLVDVLSLTTGAHELKFGVDFRKLYPVFDFSRYTQQPQFNGVDGALSGIASFVLVSTFTDKQFPVFTNLSLFGQDTWRATARLSLTFGLRWEVNPAPSAAHGDVPFSVTSLDPASLAFAPRGTPLYQTTYNNFAPRIGAAYQLSQNSGRETVLRGGVGIFYDLGTSQAAGSFGVSFPNFLSKTLRSVRFPLDPIAAEPPSFNPNPPFSTIFGVLDPHLKLPYTYQWNVAVEQSLGSNQSISASYVGAVGRRLLRQEVLQNPNPNFTLVFGTSNAATSDYHGMQLQFRRRLSRRLQLLTSYTWSHSIDTVSNDSSFNAPAVNVALNQERGPSDFDVRHALNTAATYNLGSSFNSKVVNTILRNVFVDAIFTARSATPVNVVSGTAAVGGFGGAASVSRPDLITGVPLYIKDATVAGGKKINALAFAIPEGRQGSLGRNSLRGFPMWQMDLALRRQFNVTESLKAQLSSEFFNLFNHPNFGDPGAGLNGTNVLNNAQFGQSVSMLGRSLGNGGANGGFNALYQIGGPRSIQLALKLIF